MKIAFIILAIVMASFANGTEKSIIESQVSVPEVEVIEQLIKNNSIVGFSWGSMKIVFWCQIQLSGKGIFE